MPRDERYAICIWDEGKKKTLQNYYETILLNETFYIFKEEKPEFEIGLFKIHFRSNNTSFLKFVSSEQCSDKSHEHFQLNVKCLNYEHSNSFGENYL